MLYCIYVRDSAHESRVTEVRNNTSRNINNNINFSKAINVKPHNRAMAQGKKKNTERRSEPQAGSQIQRSAPPLTILINP